MLKSLHTTAWVLGAPQSNKMEKNCLGLSLQIGKCCKPCTVSTLKAVTFSSCPLPLLAPTKASVRMLRHLTIIWEEDAQRVERLVEGERRIAKEQISEQADK